MTLLLIPTTPPVNAHPNGRGIAGGYDKCRIVKGAPWAACSGAPATILVVPIPELSMKYLRRAALAASVLVTAGLTAWLPASAASADPPPGGCPTGYQLLSVATLSAQGYMVPALIDSPTSGVVGHGQGNGASWVQQPGNGDGFVCGRALGNQVTPWGGQLYDFVDNQLPASS